MMRFPTGFLLERPSDIHSKLTGRQISKWLCVSLGISPACIPMVMLLIGELDKYWICGCIIFGALFTFNMLASNQLLFAFRKNKYVVLDSVYMRSSQNSQPNSDTPDMNSRKER